MGIKERIENIKEYFKEMQVITVNDEQVIYVVVKFPRGWVIDAEVELKYDVTIGNYKEPNEYFFSTTIDKGEDIIFDAIEYNIEKMKDAIERAQLLKDKMLQLKEIFEDENISLEDLRNLNFTWDKTEHTPIQDIMRDKGNIIIANDSISVGISTTSNNQNATTSAEVERQYTSEDNKNNKKNKK